MLQSYFHTFIVLGYLPLEYLCTVLGPFILSGKVLQRKPLDSGQCFQSSEFGIPEAVICQKLRECCGLG